MVKHCAGSICCVVVELEMIECCSIKSRKASGDGPRSRVNRYDRED